VSTPRPTLDQRPNGDVLAGELEQVEHAAGGGRWRLSGNTAKATFVVTVKRQDLAARFPARAVAFADNMVRSGG